MANSGNAVYGIESTDERHTQEKEKNVKLQQGALTLSQVLGSTDCAAFKLKQLSEESYIFIGRKTSGSFDLCTRLKIKNCHNANSVVTSDNAGCSHDNLRCRQWRQSWPNIENTCMVSLLTTKLASWLLSVFKGNTHPRHPSRTGAKPWWRHQMKTFSALLTLCVGNSPVTGEFPSKRPVTRSFDVFFSLRLNKRLRKLSWGWWFETPPRRPLWRHCNASIFSTAMMSDTQEFLMRFHRYEHLCPGALDDI